MLENPEQSGQELEAGNVLSSILDSSISPVNFEWIFDYQSWIKWFNENRNSFSKDIEGEGSIAYKGIGLFGMRSLIDTGVLSRSLPDISFVVPQFLIVTSEFISGGKTPNVDEVTSRTLVASLSENGALKELLDGRIRGEFGDKYVIVVRSLGSLEEGPGKSAAGAYWSDTLYLGGEYESSWVMNKIGEVVGSAFSPRVLTLCEKYGEAPTFPGVIIQEEARFDGGVAPHLIVTTSREGWLKGTLSGLNHIPLAGHGFSDEIFEIPIDDASGEFFRHRTNDKTPEAIFDYIKSAFDTIKFFSRNGSIPIEMEFCINDGEEGSPFSIALLQHRFVMKDAKVVLPHPESKPLYRTNESMGQGMVSSNWLIEFYLPHDREFSEIDRMRSGLELYLLEKEILKRGESFILNLGPGAAHWQQHREYISARFLRALGILEVTSRDEHVSSNPAVQHVERAMSDSGQVFVSAVAPGRSVGESFRAFEKFLELHTVEVVTASPEEITRSELFTLDFDPEDEEVKEAIQRLYSGARNARAVRLREPLTLIVDRESGVKGVFFSVLI